MTAADDQLLLEAARLSPLAFTKLTFPQYQIKWFHRRISDALYRASTGELDRVMIFMPPRYGKSEMVSVRFPAWYLGRYADRRFMHASYSIDLAEDFGRKARNLMASPEYRAIFPGVVVASDSSAAARFDIAGHRGGYYAAGVGGPLTGRGADILNIDDPVKNRQEAESETVRDNIWDWYTSTAYTRLEGRGVVILTMTRWHEDDLAGRLLKEQEAGGDQWHVISLPAIADDGTPLWPEKYSPTDLAAIKRQSARDWEAMYQQRPAPLEGGIFRREWWQYYTPATLPRITRVEHCIDSSFKTGVSNDYSVIATWGRGADTRYYLLDLWRGKWEMPELLVNIHKHYRKHQKAYPGAVVTIEDRASGQSAIQMLKRPLPQLRGAPLPALPVIGFKIPNGASKVSRAEAVSGIVEAGHVCLPERPEWQGSDLETFLREHSSFPNAAHDDAVDTTSMGLLRLSRMRGQEGYDSYAPVVTPRGEPSRRRW